MRSGRSASPNIADGLRREASQVKTNWRKKTENLSLTISRDGRSGTEAGGIETRSIREKSGRAVQVGQLDLFSSFSQFLFSFLLKNLFLKKNENKNFFLQLASTELTVYGDEGTRPPPGGIVGGTNSFRDI